MKQKGFTLVEMMIVIAILGIFASIVFASLTRSREEAKDKGTIANFTALRTQAEIYLAANHSSYGSAIKIKEMPDGSLLHDRDDGTVSVYSNLSFPVADFCSDANVQNLIREIGRASGKVVFCSVSEDGTTYRAYAPLSDPKQAVCIDSSGYFDVITNFPDPVADLTVQIELATDNSDGPVYQCS